MAGRPEDKAELRLSECARAITVLGISDGSQPRVVPHRSVIHAASLSTQFWVSYTGFMFQTVGGGGFACGLHVLVFAQVTEKPQETPMQILNSPTVCCRAERINGKQINNIIVFDSTGVWTKQAI